jgi:hypothetical protein
MDDINRNYGGERGIRTLDTVTRITP